MSPVAAARHGMLQAEVGILLQSLASQGRVITECPISTASKLCPHFPKRIQLQ